MEAIELAGLPWAERPGAVRRSSTTAAGSNCPSSGGLFGSASNRAVADANTADERPLPGLSPRRLPMPPSMHAPLCEVVPVMFFSAAKRRVVLAKAAEGAMRRRGDDMRGV